jgi:tetratricopeptide (TPR) repeat protein
MASFWISLAANAKPPGGSVAACDANDRAAVATGAADDERAQALNDAIQARDQADRSRAAFELSYKSGKLPADAKGDFDRVVSDYAKSIDRPLVSQDVMKVVAYCHLRLAGAYQYVGEFDKAVAQAKDASNVSAGTAEEVDATYNVGLIYLQALHDPKEALTWMKHAQGLVASVLPDASDHAKWLTATAEGIRRCEQEAGR